MAQGVAIAPCSSPAQLDQPADRLGAGDVIAGLTTNGPPHRRADPPSPLIGVFPLPAGFSSHSSDAGDLQGTLPPRRLQKIAVVAGD